MNSLLIDFRLEPLSQDTTHTTHSLSSPQPVKSEFIGLTHVNKLGKATTERAVTAGKERVYDLSFRSYTSILGFEEVHSLREKRIP